MLLVIASGGDRIVNGYEARRIVADIEQKRRALLTERERERLYSQLAMLTFSQQNIRILMGQQLP